MLLPKQKPRDSFKEVEAGKVTFKHEDEGCRGKNSLELAQNYYPLLQV